MGYLDNTSVIVDAILTKKGRELLSRQDGSFRITQFALADDEIDYSLYNENHPNGSNYYGEAIENLPLIEAIPNGNNVMVSKLTTLPRGTTSIPVLQVQSTAISVGRGSNFTISPVTLNLAGTNNSQESGYSFTIADRRLLSTATTSGRVVNSVSIPYTGAALSQTIVGTTFTGTTISGITLFGNNSVLTTSIIVVGLDTGARATITLSVNKNNTASAISAQR